LKNIFLLQAYGLETEITCRTFCNIFTVTSIHSGV